jgi:hypothetical protein
MRLMESPLLTHVFLPPHSPAPPLLGFRNALGQNVLRLRPLISTFRPPSLLAIHIHVSKYGGRHHPVELAGNM